MLWNRIFAKVRLRCEAEWPPWQTRPGYCCYLPKMWGWYFMGKSTIVKDHWTILQLVLENLILTKSLSSCEGVKGRMSESLNKLCRRHMVVCVWGWGADLLNCAGYHDFLFKNYIYLQIWISFLVYVYNTYNCLYFPDLESQIYYLNPCLSYHGGYLSLPIVATRKTIENYCSVL